MEAIQNAVEKVFGESNVTDEDIARAVEHVEDLKHRKFELDVAAEKKIAQAAKELHDKKHELLVKNRDHNKEWLQAADKCVTEQRKKQEMDFAGAVKINEATDRVLQLKYETVAVDSNHLIMEKNIANAVGKKYDLQHELFKNDLAAEKKIISAAEDLEKESYKRKVDNLEANMELAQATEKLEKERQKKVEMDLAADARIREAAEKVDQLGNKQMQQKSHQTVNAISNIKV